MQLLDLTLDTPVENLALDEALLEAAEQSGQPGEVLRLWESPHTIVVIGNSSRLSDEVNLEACRRRKISVLRRPSGGAAVVAGPGCLMYALVLSYQLHPELQMIDRAHRFVLDSIAKSLGSFLPGTKRAGISDLVLGERKFSGNSLRCKRTHFLYHGTLLYRFDLARIGELLNMPARQPEYRHQRPHSDFVTNIPIDAASLRQAMIAAFDAQKICDNWPRELTAQLAAEKYSHAEWNDRF
jgi:lipoate-protein ligase A